MTSFVDNNNRQQSYFIRATKHGQNNWNSTGFHWEWMAINDNLIFTSTSSSTSSSPDAAAASSSTWLSYHPAEQKKQEIPQLAKKLNQTVNLNDQRHHPKRPLQYPYTGRKFLTLLANKEVEFRCSSRYTDDLVHTSKERPQWPHMFWIYLFLEIFYSMTTLPSISLSVITGV